MKILTKENDKTEIERLTLKEIMLKQEEFTFNEISKAIRALCDDEISTDEIQDIVFNAFDLALSEGYIDFVGRFTYMVDPLQQIMFFNQEGNITL